MTLFRLVSVFFWGYHLEKVLEEGGVAGKTTVLYTQLIESEIEVEDIYVAEIVGVLAGLQEQLYTPVDHEENLETK